MHVLSVSSLKVGVGKTTVALGLASAAYAAGLRTLVVDLDPQCDATTGLGVVGNFDTTIASVLKSPKHDIVSKAIVASAWGKSGSGFVDLMVGSSRSLHFDTPHPSTRQTWILEEALHRVERDYDLVIIDTPPAVNALTRTAWVASDRILVVSEPSIFSVVAAEKALRAIEEIREAFTKRVRTFGVLINRYRPASKEQDFRVQELQDMFGDLLLPQYLEERAHLQQTQGAARPIHTWPGESAAEIAAFFTWLLNQVLDSFTAAGPDTRYENTKEKKRIFKRRRRGKKAEQKVSIEEAFELLGEPVNEVPVAEEVQAVEEVQEPATDTGNWNFTLEIEKPKED